jgi:hypothetical protein
LFELLAPVGREVADRTQDRRGSHIVTKVAQQAKFLPISDEECTSALHNGFD